MEAQLMLRSTYKMQIEYDDPICPRTGVCSGATPAQCPHAYMDLSKPEGDPSRPETMPLQCLQANVGVSRGCQGFPAAMDSGCEWIWLISQVTITFC